MVKEKKVGIMTLFNCYNYGAVLQAYATYKFVKNLGYDNVELINYENKYESKMKKTIPFVFCGNIKDIIKKFIQYIFMGKNRHLRKSFIGFCESLNKSKIIYKNIDELKKSDYDILISGSDQIWNPVIFNELDGSYLLDFSEKAKKISISSSAGSYVFTGDNKKNIIKCLNKYDAISVREESLKNQLQDSIKKDIFVSMDPTLLLNHDEWVSDLKSTNKYGEENSKYILVYIVDANLKTYYEEIETLKERLKLPVWLITPYKFKMKYIDKNIVNATPNDFISLFDNAEVVITNSYHGVLFSTNFKKKFVALENHRNPIRTKDFLNKLSISDRIVKNKSDAENVEIYKQNFEYYDKLNKFLMDTKNWIGDSLSE